MNIEKQLHHKHRYINRTQKPPTALGTEPQHQKETKHKKGNKNKNQKSQKQKQNLDLPVFKSSQGYQYHTKSLFHQNLTERKEFHPQHL